MHASGQGGSKAGHEEFLYHITRRRSTLDEATLPLGSGPDVGDEPSTSRRYPHTITPTCAPSSSLAPSPHHSRRPFMRPSHTHAREGMLTNVCVCGPAGQLPTALDLPALDVITLDLPAWDLQPGHLSLEASHSRSSPPSPVKLSQTWPRMRSRSRSRGRGQGRANLKSRCDPLPT